MKHETPNVLDCTLRDGGYVNNWEFGENNIRKIFTGLQKSGDEFIECGFISEKEVLDKNRSQYPNFESASALRGGESLANGYGKELDQKCLAMINFGEFDIANVPERNETLVDGIRVTCINKTYKEACEFCRQLIDKGYMVFLQPMSTIRFSEQQLDDLLETANKINLHSVYIVDSFGSMDEVQLTKLLNTYQTKLDNTISIGFHSHNNLQQSYYLAQSFLENRDNVHDIVVDASIYGMGRGAGNLNTELFLDYLNKNFDDKNYQIEPLLQLMDDVILKIFRKKFWGYQMPYFLSAKYNCHPNYATFLADMNTLTVADIDSILAGLSDDQCAKFDKDLIAAKYIEYQGRSFDDSKNIDLLKKRFASKNVVIVGPGKSIARFDFSKLPSDATIVSTNFEPTMVDVDYVFMSNAKRFKENSNGKDINKPLIVTSNIDVTSGPCITVNYNALLNNHEVARDNSLLMLLKLIERCGSREVFLVGFDGYRHDQFENYYDEDKTQLTTDENIDLMNQGVKDVIKELKGGLNVTFLTRSLLK
jgi:4-hydroxy 2-oxovalerate aldolase